MDLAGQLPLDFAIEDEFSFRTFVAPAKGGELLDGLRRAEAGGENFYYVWGAAGSGKSHLLQALCLDREEGAVYLPLARFAERGPALLEGLAALPLVCLDDLDRVIGDRDWEEGLFALYNAMRENGHRLVVTALAPPRVLRPVLADLGSRLSWGMVYQLEELDDRGKAEALRIRAHDRGFDLGDELLAYILLRSARSTASLFAVLDRLDQLSLAEQRKITIPFIRQIMHW